MLTPKQVWRRTYACFTASLLAALQPSLMFAAEPALPEPLPLLAENAAPAPAAATATSTSTPAPIPTDPANAAPVLPDPNAAAPQPILNTPSQNVTLNLINRLVQKGILTHGEATDLIKGAEEDAAFAKAQAQALAETQAAVAAQTAMPPVQPDAEEVRVTYIPETVKAQIREQLRTEVFEQARAQHWAAPGSVPEWTQRIKLFGDVRMLYQGFNFPNGNDNTTGAFPNFNAINSGQPFNFGVDNLGLIPPQLNVDKSRDTYLMRMRLGFDIDLQDGFTAGIRFATGSTNTPVSTNQALAAAGPGGQGGNFSKYQLWLDRAFIKYESSLTENTDVALFLGRFDNLFMTSSEIMWDEDVALDGAAFKLKSTWSPDFKTWLSGGAFAVFNSALNFPDNSTTKGQSYDKYLFAAQFGVEFKVTDDIEGKMSLAYYDWENIEGRFSSPFVPASVNDAGDTDNSRPLFAQKGNTYRKIRNITPTAGASPGGNLNGTVAQFQYFGLATKFRQIAWAGRLDFNHLRPLQVSLLGEFVKNVGLDTAAMRNLNRPDPVVNNRSGGTGNWEGGDTAWYMGVNFGKPTTLFNERGDWAFGVGYRYVESDAVVDGFTDSNFGGGGTNMKGYTLSAALALSKQTALHLSYMAAAQIAGPTLRSDVIMFDLTARF
ncbi:putative porin [Prosthecobacter sp.]|uniref:putative porin n=1 Tax=Prosthecobacter sp. TaxID=1965333 RepID=UPI00378505DA